VDALVIVSVEVPEDTLEFRWGQLVAVLAEAPHEFAAVKLHVTVVVHAAEDATETADSVGTTCLKSVTDFAEHCKWWLTFSAECGAHVGVISAATVGSSEGELFIVEAAVAIFVEFGKHSPQLEVFEIASECLEGTRELCRLNCSQAVFVEVLEDLLYSPSLVLSAVGFLTNLLKDNALNLCEASL